MLCVEVYVNWYDESIFRVTFLENMISDAAKAPKTLSEAKEIICRFLCGKVLKYTYIISFIAESSFKVIFWIK